MDLDHGLQIPIIRMNRIKRKKNLNFKYTKYLFYKHSI